MEKIEVQIGDIKKFKTAKGEVAGIVVYKEGRFISVLDLGGLTRNINTAELLDITAVRLNPEIRERMNKIGEVLKERERIGKEEQKLKEQRRQVETKLGKQVDIMLKNLGVYSKVDFERVLAEEIGKKFRAEYRVYVYTNSNTVHINLTRDKEVAKYPKEGDYSFLYREYDGNMFVEPGGREYDLTVKKYSQSGIELGVLKKLPKEFKVKEDRELSMGDKYLVYSHAIYIEVKYDKFDKQLLSAVLKILT